MAITKISPDVVDFDAGITISTADNTDNLTLTSTDADSSFGPNLNFYRNSSSPADDDLLAQIDFNGRNDNSQDVLYANIQTQIIDASDGTEDGRFQINTIVAGTDRNRFLLTPTETVFNDNSIDLDFRVESDVNANSFYLDGATGVIGLGFANTTAANQLHILGTDSVPSVNMTLQTDDTANATAGITLMSRNSSNTNVNATLTNVTTALQSSLGITFGSDTAAANALDDYEEGTWTPDLIGCDDNLSSPTGHYTKIGRLVYFYWYSGAFTISNQSGVAFIDGLPFTTRSNSGQAYSTFQFVHGDAVDGNSTGGYVEHAANKIRFIDAGTTDSASYVNGARYIMVSGIYEAA